MTAVEAVHRNVVEVAITLKTAELTPRAAREALAAAVIRPMQTVSTIDRSGSARQAPSTGSANVTICLLAET